MSNRYVPVIGLPHAPTVPFYVTTTEATSGTDGSLTATTVVTPTSGNKARLLAIHISAPVGAGGLISVLSTDTSVLNGFFGTSTTTGVMYNMIYLDRTTTAIDKLWQISAVAASFGNSKKVVITAYWADA